MHQLDEQNMPIHRALLIPEILDQIFIQMLPSKDCIDPLIKSSIRDLQSCACVSRLWNIMATRQLWYNPCYLQGDNIPKVLSKIEHERRQYYASHIKEGSLFTFPDRNPKLSPKEPIDVLDELEFPKLRYVTLVAGYHASVVPPIKSQNVRTLVIDPKHWLYRGIFVNMAEVGRILEQVPVCRAPQMLLDRQKKEYMADLNYLLLP
ncbi:hypothetical protein AAP_04449 [Ascosphaera apis ARSEF 7405]|uniref:Uncharacterized protein n=1 Tax=Ascosphaera apis ARSEF 7405 TaxID=392613 RepID=A0A167WUS2_9EURO|nr:hypothetical protein AAP_04449 [Ascosphaera apis ARSEF 7405]